MLRRMYNEAKAELSYLARALFWRMSYGRYAKNPFRVSPRAISEERYELLYEHTKQKSEPLFLKELEKSLKMRIPREFIHDLAKTTQIVIKKNILSYVHGHLLYVLLLDYAKRHKKDAITVLETGTARGFSAMCMAKALSDARAAGRIVSVDILPSRQRIYWNCIADATGRKTRFELLDKWKELVEKYILFLQGHSDMVLRQLGVSRIHFAFIDGQHDYETVTSELRYIAKMQRKGDIIVCDDYNMDAFPGIVKAIDTFVKRQPYCKRIFGESEKRRYVCLTRAH